LKEDLYAWPDRGRAVEMPPKDPLIYRLYEIIQVCVVADGRRREGLRLLIVIVIELWCTDEGGAE